MAYEVTIEKPVCNVGKYYLLTMSKAKHLI